MTCRYQLAAGFATPDQLDYRIPSVYHWQMLGRQTDKWIDMTPLCRGERLVAGRGADPLFPGQADVAMVSLEKGMEGGAVPSKAICGMAAGSALLVLAGVGTELESWIERHQCGVGYTHWVRRWAAECPATASCRQEAAAELPSANATGCR